MISLSSVAICLCGKTWFRNKTTDVIGKMITLLLMWVLLKSPMNWKLIVILESNASARTNDASDMTVRGFSSHQNISSKPILQKKSTLLSTHWKSIIFCRFQQELFGFMYSVPDLASEKNSSEMWKLCSTGGRCRSCGFFQELTRLITLLDNSCENIFSVMQIFQFIHGKEQHKVYPNTAIALRIFLTKPVIVSQAERTLSKLMLIKTSRCTIYHDR